MARAETPDAMTTFSLDFDKTFTADPDLFREFVRAAQRRGHTVLLTTQRCVEHLREIRGILGTCDLPLVFASGFSKEEASAFHGFAVDVWVDDSPYSVSTALRYRDCRCTEAELEVPVLVRPGENPNGN